MRYKQLRSDDAEIRLLEILPVKDETRLSFRLHHILLDNAPKFWAFSYCWGDDNNKLVVSVDNHSFGVTHNLYRILWNHAAVMAYGFRKRLHNSALVTRYIWVDSICINQVDLKERAEQIKLMGRIYSTGFVGAYLDNVDKKIDTQAMELLRSNGYWKQAGKAGPGLASQIMISDDEWTSLYSFFTKAWFRRMWVIQEICLAKRSWMWIHTRLLPMEDAYFAVRDMFEMHPANLTTSQATEMRAGMKELLSLLELKYDLSVGQPPCLLLTLLWLFRDRLSSDPRDKVYALLGLLEFAKAQETTAPGGSRSGLDLDNIIIDYNAGLEDIYTSLVKAVVLDTGCLDIICASQPPNTFSRSWVPNWEEPWARFSLLTNNMHQFGIRTSAKKEVYRASATRLASVTFSDNDRTLAAAGFSWGRITHLITPPPCQHLRSETVLAWLISTLIQLPRHIQESLLRKFRDEQNPEVSLSESAAFDAFGAEWANGMNGGYTYQDEGRGLNYLYFNANLDLNWHENARTYRRFDKDGRECGVRDLRFYQLAHRRRIFVDERGSFGWVPDGAAIGDTLSVLLGCSVPVVLRQVGKKGYTLVGEAYVQHLMKGQMIEALERGEVKLASFNLV